MSLLRPRMVLAVGGVLSLLYLVVFVHQAANFVSDPAKITTVAVLNCIGFFALSLSLGYFAYNCVQGQTRIRPKQFLLGWGGLVWGMISLFQRYYPWNIGIAVILLLVGVFVSYRITLISKSSR